MTKQLHVEVAYALPEQQFVVPVLMDEGATVEEVITQSGLLERFNEIDLNTNRVGIFSRLAKLTDLVQDGDRVEIYRPLLADPKEIRRRRAQEQAEAAKNKTQ